MLRIAVPNKGMLSEPAWNMLAEAGYRLRSNPRQLVVEDPDNDVELFYLRPLDIAVYVGRGTIDVGITGHDLLLNSGTDAKEHMELGFGASTFRFAAPNDSPISKLEDIEGKRVKLFQPYWSCMIIWLSMASTLKPYTLMVPSNRQCNSVWLI